MCFIALYVLNLFYCLCFLILYFLNVFLCIMNSKAIIELSRSNDLPCISFRNKWESWKNTEDAYGKIIIIEIFDLSPAFKMQNI